MKKLLVIQLFLFIFIFGQSQTPLIIDGEIYTNSDSDWDGVEMPRDTPVLLTFRNNSITSINTNSYMLLAGQDGYDSRAHNLDNAKITGNRIDWNGTPGAQLCHGIMAGYNLNYTIKYNYVDGPYYGIVHEGGYDDGDNMVNTAGGISYNIFRNCPTPILTWGYENVSIYNNTFYYGLPASTNGLVRVGSSNGTDIPAPSGNVKIKNNIFYSVSNVRAIDIIDIESLTGFECDYNVYYWESTPGNLPRFRINGVSHTWAQWRALGYDAHSVIVDPGFQDDIDFTPSARLEYGVNLSDYDYGLSSTSGWNVGNYPDTVLQGNNWQVGAKIFQTGSETPTPIYVNSVIENSSPARLQMTYNLTLANIAPAPSAFSVTVNSYPRSVSSVAISGTNVLLTLSSPVVYGDVVTIAYSKPASNPLQTAAGGQAASISTQQVTNSVTVVIPVPVYVSSVIENSSPARLQMTYSLTLANIAPVPSAFSVTVNTYPRSVSSVAISGTNVLLTLSSPAVYGDVVTIAYTKPASNPLQTGAGGQAASISTQQVTNSVTVVNQPPVVVISSPQNGQKYKKYDIIVIEAVASDPDGSISMIEFKNGSITIAELTTNPYLFPWEVTDTGTFMLSVIATDNLGATSASSIIEIIVDHNYDNNAEIINLYPNPNSGRFKIELFSPLSSEKNSIAIVSVTGNTIYNGKFAEGEYTKHFDFSDSAPGAYVLLINSENTIITTSRFIKN